MRNGSIERVAWRLRISPGREKDYVKAHESLSDELVALLKRVGYRKFSIFVRDQDVFLYVETRDFSEAIVQIMRSPEFEQQSRELAGIIEKPSLRHGEMVMRMQEVFHLD